MEGVVEAAGRQVSKFVVIVGEDLDNTVGPVSGLVPLGDRCSSELATLFLDDEDALADKELEGGIVADILYPLRGKGMEQVPTADERPTALNAVDKGGDVSVDRRGRLGPVVGDVERQWEVSPMFNVEGREASARVDGGIVRDLEVRKVAGPTRVGCIGDKRQMATMIENKTSELAMHEDAKNRRRAIDKMAPRGNKISVDIEEVGAGGDAADSGGAMEARDITAAARDREGSTETVKTGKTVPSASAGPGEQISSTASEAGVDKKTVSGGSLDPVGVSSAEAEIDPPKSASAVTANSLSRLDHFDGVGNAVLAEEAGEQGAAGADLLRWARVRAANTAEGAVRVTLRRVVVSNEARELAKK